MLTVSFVVFALLGHAISAPSLIPRDDSPPDTDLFLSCPGAAGSPNIEGADKCTLVNIVNNPDTHVVTNLGDVQAKYVLRSYDHPATAILSTQFSCEGSTSPIMLTVGGETTVGTTTTANVDVGVDFGGFSIGGGISTESSSDTTKSKSTTVSIPPGRQSVMTMNILSHSQSGNVQWFTGTVITQVTPTNEVTFDVHETACGTDPLDLSNNS